MFDFFRKIRFIIVAGGLVIIVLGGLVYTGVFKLPAAKAHDCSAVPPAENAVVIRMEKGAFEPKELTVNTCDTILFLNLDEDSKWPVVSSLREYPGFDAGHELKKFDYFTFQVTRNGTYSFQDHMHKDIVGKITINDKK